MKITLPLLWVVCCLGTVALFANEPSDFSSGLQPVLTPTAPLEPVPLGAERPLRLPAIESDVVAASADLAPGEPAPAPLPAESSADAPVPITPPVEEYTLDQLKTEMSRLAWTKGDYRIVPYGILWGSMNYQTERTNSGDYTFFVLSRDDEGEDAFHVDGKSTRFGIDVFGPQIPLFGCMQSGGKIEFDFQGPFVTENRGTVLLRHAYVELKDESTRLLFGQTWDVVSPLNPNMLMYSIGWGGGNIGYRRAQFRVERYVPVSDRLLITAQGSLNHDMINTGDLPSTSGIRGDHAGWPVLEGRLAATLGERGPGCLPWTFGVSSHVGEQIYDFRLGPDPVDDMAIKTWSLNSDLQIPITERFGFQGEFFTGENLGPFLGGVIQGINIFTREGIRSTGGWGEVYYRWTPRLHSHFGAGIDDPLDEDVPAVDGARTYNQFSFANLLLDVTPKFTVGMEVSAWKTLYRIQSPGESVNIEFGAKYGF
jgi:hypothetical protein